MEAGVRAAAREESDRRRGVSGLGFLLTVAVLLLLLLAVLEFVNRWTRIPAPAPSASTLKTTLDVAVRTLTRDLGAAASGVLPPAEAVRPVADNTLPGRTFTGPVGQVTAIRAGTDQIGLRGILRTPVLPLEASDRGTGRPFQPVAGGVDGLPGPGLLKVYAGGNAGTTGGGATGDGLSQVTAMLTARPPSVSSKRYFLAGGSGGQYAVARIVSVRDRTASGPDGCAPQPDGCHLELTLDFADPDAVRLNPRRAAVLPSALGPLSWGGLFDDLVYFVAEGPKGRPPDYFIVNDPPSLAHPCPYLAVAANVGAGRCEVLRVADDVENLQAAYAVGKGGAEDWLADRPGARPLRTEELTEPGAELLAVGIALVAKGTQRRRGSSAGDILEEILPFDAPRPDRTFSPVGWAESRRARVDFDRETRFLSVRFGKPR
jgi:hypothetical protein